MLLLAASRSKSVGDSFGVLFADLTAAFDSIIREIVLGQLWNDDYFCRILSRLNTPPSEWRALLASIQASGGVGRLANLDEQLIDLIAGMHCWHVVLDPWDARSHCPNFCWRPPGQSHG